MAQNVPKPVATARARVATLTRSRPKHDPDLIAAQTDLAAANIEAAIRKNLAAAPPLSRDQLNALHAVLGGAR
jgi:hypothetical protein